MAMFIKTCGCINAAVAWSWGEDQISICETHLETIALFFQAFVKDSLQSSGI